MNGVGRLVGGTPEIGEGREAPSGANLRQETGEGGGFRSVLSRIAGLVRESAISSEAGEKATARDEERLSTPKPNDEPFAGAPGNAAGGPLHAAERQIGMLPIQVGERLESLRGATATGGHDPRPVARFPPLRDSEEIAVPAGASDRDSTLFDAIPLAPPPSDLPSAFQELGEGLGQTSPATREMSIVAVEPIPVVHALAMIVSSRVVDVETGAAVAATPPVASFGRRSEPGIGLGDDAAVNLNIGRPPQSLEAPLVVTVISRERHLAPAQRTEPAKLRPLACGPAAHAPVDPSKERSVALDGEAAGRNERPARRTDTPAVPDGPEVVRQDWAGERPVARQTGAPPAPASTTSPTEGAVVPVGAQPGLNQNVLQKIAGSVIETAQGAMAVAGPAGITGLTDRSVGPSPVRVLNVRVDVPGHGAVHVRLALSGDALSIRVRADSEEIADGLRQEQAKLSEALSAAGYDPEIVAIEARKTDALPLSRNDPVTVGTDGAPHAHHGEAGGERRPPTRQPQTAEHGFGEHSPSHDREAYETPNSSRRGASDLYV